MKIIHSCSYLLALLCAATLTGCTSVHPKPVLPSSPQQSVGLNPGEGASEKLAADYLAEAVLASGDMCFKMPVLEAGFSDTPEWERRLQGIINREQWAFAKVHFIHFYWKRVTKKDNMFMARMLEYVRSYRIQDDSLGIVDDMLGATDSEGGAQPRVVPSTSPVTQPSDSEATKSSR